MSRRSIVSGFAMCAALVGGMGCQYNWEVPPAQRPMMRLNVFVSPTSDASSHVHEDSGTGVDSFYETQTIDCSAGEYCDLYYCTAPFITDSAPTRDGLARFECPPPTAADGRYHVTLVATPDAGSRFDGWEILTGPLITQPTTSDLRSPTLDLSWDEGAPLGSGFVLEAHFSLSTSASPAPIAGCTGPTTEMLNPGQNAPDLLLACGSVVLADKLGDGSQTISAGPAKVVATDGTSAFYDQLVSLNGEDAYQIVGASMADAMYTEVVAPVQGSLPVLWIGVDDTYLYYVEATPNGNVLFSANKDGTPFDPKSGKSHTMFGERNVLAADVDDRAVYFAYDDTGSVTIAELPKGSDAATQPTVLAAHLKTQMTRLHHTTDALYWGTTSLPFGSKGPTFLSSEVASDSSIDGSTLYFASDACVESLPLVAGASVAPIDCTAGALQAIAVDEVDVFWVRDNVLGRAAK